jgi:hypothetical protein
VTTDFFDTFSEDEAKGADEMMRDLAGVAWAQPLLKVISTGGGLTGVNKPFFFELRFSHALHAAGIAPSYEIPGEGDSTIDYGFANGGHEFRVEMMRLTETQAAKEATHESVGAHGIPWISRALGTNAENPKQSEEGETLKAIERICQKCERGGKPYKFLPPDKSINVLLVDFRTFLNGGDIHDRIHVALGGKHVGGIYRRYWKGNLISGVFSPETTLKGAAEARERIHLIGFVNEKAYGAGAFAPATQFVANPYLFASADEARAVLAAWPLQPARLI